MFDFLTPSSDNEKLPFMQHWYRWFHQNTKKWEGNLAADIAYLFGAIMNDKFVIVTSRSEIVQLLREKNVATNSSIWKYLRLVDN